MAKLTFIGAAGTVTGSKHLLETGGRRIFIDCGLFQGSKSTIALNEAPLPIEPDDLEAVVITHGHLDHIGYLPKLVRDGFSGPVYCTPPTQALMQIVLDDAAHLQEEMLRRGLEHEHPTAPPAYYDDRDVAHAMRLVKTVPLGTRFDVVPGIQGTFHNAGHVLGSAFVVLEIEGKHVIFSGDLGRYNRALLYDPESVGPVDTLVCESTYANRPHPADSEEALRAALLSGIERGGVMVMPAFAVERTQDILLSIARIQEQDARIAELPVHVDSPMAEKVDDLFARFPESHKPLPCARASDPFGVRNFSIAVTTEDSKQLNHLAGPRLIISASGMASGGRVLHHLHNHLADPHSTIIFVGYQSQGSLGFVITHGARAIHLFGDVLPVRATIVDLPGFSGHADETDFARWFATCEGKPHLYAVHGEPESALALAAYVRAQLGWAADAAHRGTTVDV
jgi:metallo-beta-lactamase family protein